MSKLSDLIATARAEIGTRETGANIVKYNDWFWGTGYRADGASYPWCVVFCAFICKFAPTPVDFPMVAHCDRVRSYAQEKGRWITGNYQPGDFIIFDYGGDGSGDHIGLVVSKNGNTLQTIEGNYADSVCSVTRQINSQIIGAYRPDYGTDESEDDAADETPEQPSSDSESRYCTVELKLPCKLGSGDISIQTEFLQFLLALNGCTPANSVLSNGSGRFDGEYGPNTENCVKQVQQVAGISPADGIVTEECWKALLKILGG